MRWITIALLLCLASMQSAQAEEEWAFGATYDPSVPTLDAYLGRPFAERHARVEEILGYVRLLASSSDRVQLREMGTSVEGDPLVLLIISDPSNETLLEDRSARLSEVIDPWNTPAHVRRRAVDGLLPMTWIACSVHGDEASGADAGLMLAYHLAADQSAATRAILERSIVAIDPCQNPDGRRRFLGHVRSFQRQRPGPDTDPDAMEHHQLWPGGRRNHYMFDMNRDWAFLTQQETRHRVASFMELRPQVFADLHEMGRQSSYFFPPPTDPVNPNVPLELREWWDVFGRANAHAFDARGFDYFVRESFDLFFPGYGDSWPTLQGAIGMTYEQATTRGNSLRNTRGDILNYRSAVLHHFTAALATCATTARNDRELLQSFARYFELAKERSETDEVREILLSANDRPAEMHSLAQKLVAQGIAVDVLDESVTAKLRSYVGGEESTLQLPAGSLRIQRAQPAYTLLRSLLDLHTPMDEHFLAQERERKERGLNDRFYDVSAWSLILSHGLRAYESTRTLDVATHAVQLGEAKLGSAEAARGDELYAYLIPYDDNAALTALCRLLWRGVRVSVSQDSFRQNGRDYPRGTLVIRRRENSAIEELDLLISEIVERAGARAYRSASAWSDAGPSLGSGRMLDVDAPRIAMLSGPGTLPQSVGDLRWVLEMRYEIPHTFMLIETLEEANLSDLDVLIIPGLRGDPGIDSEQLDDWMRAGGTLVTIASASSWVVDQEEQEWTTAELVSDLRVLEASRETSEEGESEENSFVPHAFRPDRSPGAIVRLAVDLDSPLSVGENSELFAPILSDRLFRPSLEGRNVLTYADDSPRVAGFMWPSTEAAIPGLAYMIHERVGQGNLILFAEDPAFRGSWEGLDRVLLHSLILAPNLGD